MTKTKKVQPRRGAVAKRRPTAPARHQHPLLDAALSELAGSDAGARIKLTARERAQLPIGWQQRLRKRLQEALDRRDEHIVAVEELIAKARARSGRSAKEIAGSIGLPAEFVAELEAGIDTARILEARASTIAALTDVLAIPRSEFVLSLTTALGYGELAQAASVAEQAHGLEDRDAWLLRWIEEYVSAR
ncbi:MAG: hypothetical protein AABM40_04615 [Chloroflexota bacterium]